MSNQTDIPSLGSLIEKTQNLLANLDIPFANRSIPEVQPIVKRLAENYDTSSDVDAVMFFAKRGIDIIKQQELIESLGHQTVQPAESIESTVDLSVERWMETQQSQLISSTIEECDNYNNVSFQDYFIMSLNNDWTNMKNELLESLDYDVSIDIYMIKYE